MLLFCLEVLEGVVQQETLVVTVSSRNGTAYGKYWMYRSVSHIRPRFATLALVESVGGAYMRDLTFYLANTPPLPVPRLDVDIGTLYYRPVEAADLPSLLILLSRSPEPQILNGQDRLTEVGHSVDSSIFQAFRGFVLSMCCC